jgi:prepilin-type N-terminal cleavage/methylation domain-containing protein
VSTEVTMQSKRRGFTVLELVIVLTLVGIVAGITVSGYTRSRQHVQNGIAMRHVEAYAVTARSAAMQRGRTTALHVEGDQTWITVDSSGTELVIGPPVRLRDNFGVAASGPLTLVSFDPRGFASGLPPEGTRFVIQPSSGSSGRVRDTVCVSRTGQIKTQGCA